MLAELLNRDKQPKIM